MRNLFISKEYAPNKYIAYNLAPWATKIAPYYEDKMGWLCFECEKEFNEWKTTCEQKLFTRISK